MFNVFDEPTFYDCVKCGGDGFYMMPYPNTNPNNTTPCEDCSKRRGEYYKQKGLLK